MEDPISKEPLLNDEDIAAQEAMERHYKKNYEGAQMDSSFESIGNTQSFKEVHDKAIETEIQSIIIQFYLNLSILVVVYIIILIEISKGNRCGIPVREWCLVFFTLWLGKGCFNMFKILVLRNAYESRSCFTFTLYMIMNSLLVIWIVIGSFWYFSAENDCA